MYRLLVLLVLFPLPALAAGNLPTVAGIPVDFILFALTLLGVALFHNATLYVALTGLVTISLYKIIFTGFKTGVGVAGFVGHLGHEWVTLANLFCLLTGFALLARHFEKSHVPVILPKYLPDDWKGGFVLLVMVFVISSFLDNIAAALIGGAMAHQLFKSKVHVGYLAAIVAASNAGGSGSVVGDTTTTMMWIDGVSARRQVFDAYIAAGVALLHHRLFRRQAAACLFADHQACPRGHQGRLGADLHRRPHAGLRHCRQHRRSTSSSRTWPDSFPFIGVAVWAGHHPDHPGAPHDWELLPETVKGSIFLLSLVLCASMMPVEELPAASWQSAFDPRFRLGGLRQYSADRAGAAARGASTGASWPMPSASAARCCGSARRPGSPVEHVPEGKSAAQWLRHGWHVALAYVVGFAVMLAVLGWHPRRRTRKWPRRTLSRCRLHPPCPPGERLTVNRKFRQKSKGSFVCLIVCLPDCWFYDKCSFGKISPDQ